MERLVLTGPRNPMLRVLVEHGGPHAGGVEQLAAVEVEVGVGFAHPTPNGVVEHDAGQDDDPCLLGASVQPESLDDPDARELIVGTAMIGGVDQGHVDVGPGAHGFGGVDMVQCGDDLDVGVSIEDHGRAQAGDVVIVDHHDPGGH